MAPIAAVTLALGGAPFAAAGVAQASPATTVAATGQNAPAAVLPQVASGAATDLGAYNPSAQLRVVIGLKTSHPAQEQAFLQALQDPHSAQYHHYLTQAEWTSRFGPTSAAEQAVVNWAKAGGLTVAKRYPNRLVVDAVGSASQIQHALGVNIRNYRSGTGTFFANDRTPALPKSVSGVIESIGGLDSMHRMVKADGTTTATADFSAGAVASSGGSAGANGSASLLRTAMAKSASKAKAAKGSSAKPKNPSFTGGWFDPTDIFSSQSYDLNALYSLGHCCNPFHASGGTPKESSIAIATIGTHDFNDYAGFHNLYPYLAYHVFEHNIDGTPTASDKEGTMDMEWSTAWSNSMGSLFDTSTVNMYDGATNFQSTFTDEYNQMVTDNSARVMSTSWGCAEKSGATYSCDDPTRNTQHSIFDNMIGMGWSLVAASGDHGAYGNCVNVKGVMFPSSDPDVTAAGGTELAEFNGPVYSSEIGWVGDTAAGSCASNSGGSTGGCSVDYIAPSYQGSSYPCGSGSRSVPDLALNAYYSQNIYWNGGRTFGGGTSIVAPEIAGFLAQKNAYGIFLGSICGLGSGASPCAPLGQANPAIYTAMSSSPHHPVYDITSGCNGNDIGGGYCAGTGYDLVTGFGSFNALQMAWALNYRTVAEGTAPSVAYSGPTINTWNNVDRTVFWGVSDSGGSFNASGVAGYTYGWDGIPADPTSHAIPGSGDSFYAGPTNPNQTGGSLNLSSAGQGCHTVHVRGWDNMGIGSGDTTYGPVCYDTVSPTVTGPQPRIAPKVHITANGVPVHVVWTGADATSGVASYTLLKKVDTGSFATVGSFTAAAADVLLPPGHTYQFEVRATDRAGNVSTTVLGRSFKVNMAQETASTIAYTGAWTLQAVSGATGGSVKYSTASGASAKVTFNGFAVAWVTTLASNRGSASVTLNGATPTTVNTQGGSTPQPAMTIYTAGFTAGARTLLVKNLSTPGHNRIDIDSFVVLQ